MNVKECCVEYQYICIPEGKKPLYTLLCTVTDVWLIVTLCRNILLNKNDTSAILAFLVSTILYVKDTLNGASGS